MVRERFFGTKRVIVPFLVVLLSVCVITTSCWSGAKNPLQEQSRNASDEESDEDAGSTKNDRKPLKELIFQKVGFSPMESQYKPLDIVPNVKSYSVASDLSNIANPLDYPNLTPEQKQKIAENGFVVVPSDSEQLFYIYEANEYGHADNNNMATSSFVTSDTVLQLYHIFFDYALRTSEAEEFFPAMIDLNDMLLSSLMAEHSDAENVKAQLETAIGYFGVASMLMGGGMPENTPASVRGLVYEELELIESATESISPLLGVKIDYSQFTVRGHYTRSETLTNYFKAMMWYGLVPFRLYDENNKRDEYSTVCALAVVKALFDTPNAIDLWESVYSPTCFFVGSSDDVTPFQYKAVMEEAYGENVTFEDLTDKRKLDAFYREAERLPQPRINAKRSETGDTASGIQFRFMGQRYIPDSEILQELTEPIARPIPSGLDVFSVLGSERAYALNEQYNQPSLDWPAYTEVFKELQSEMAELPESQWQSNLYYGWLWALKSFTNEFGEGWPIFMQGSAWLDKSLATGLGSWAELRHDTILYGKQSGAEMGGGEPAPPPPSYVEPNAELYNKLLWLVRYSKENLQARNMLNENVFNKMERFEIMLDFLLQCSIKELRGEDLSEEDNSEIRRYGGWLEHMTTSFAEGDVYYWWEIESETDKNMALIADVHTVFANKNFPTAMFLEEAVGHAAEIYVAIPARDQVYLARGAVFDYYEFLSDKRLTDEEWQSALKNGGAPERPPWVWSFMAR